MRLLDLFCGAGGASEGYRRAGFEVVGVDIKPQPHYPFDFIEADALTVGGGPEWIASYFDAVHASPPCQAHSSLRHLQSTASVDLIAETRELLRQTGLPYIIENVVGAPLLDPVKLCGSSLGLGAMCEDGKWRQLRRHRLFESNVPLMGPPCAHQRRADRRLRNREQSEHGRQRRDAARVQGSPGGGERGARNHLDVQARARRCNPTRVHGVPGPPADGGSGEDNRQHQHNPPIPTRR